MCEQKENVIWSEIGSIQTLYIRKGCRALGFDRTAEVELKALVELSTLAPFSLDILH